MNRKCDFSNSEQVFNRGEVMVEIIVIGLIQTGWLLWKINYSKRIKKNYKGRVRAKVIDVKEYVLHIKGRGKVHAYYPTYQYSVNGIRHVAFVTGLYWLMILFCIYVRFSSDFQ